MKIYKDLNLKAIRENCELDFARHTYSHGQCSCCYGPCDMPDRYWTKGKKPANEYDDKYTYILFKNADNGCGIKRFNDFIENYTCVEYRIKDDEQKNKVCKMLQEQLGNDYFVEVPDNDMKCIIIWTTEGWANECSLRT